MKHNNYHMVKYHGKVIIAILWVLTGMSTLNQIIILRCLFFNQMDFHIKNGRDFVYHVTLDIFL